MRQLNSQWRLLQPLQSFPTDTTAFLWQSLNFRFILNAMISNVFNVLYPLNKTFSTTGNFSQGDKLSAGPVNNAALLPWPPWSDFFSSVFDLKLAKESSNLSFFKIWKLPKQNIENEATKIEWSNSNVQLRVVFLWPFVTSSVSTGVTKKWLPTSTPQKDVHQFWQFWQLCISSDCC